MHLKKLDIYLVANKKALGLLNQAQIITNLRDILNGLFNINLKTIPLDLNKKDPPYLDSRHAYTVPYLLPPPPPPQPKPPPQPDNTPIKHFHAAWQPSYYIYTDA